MRRCQIDPAGARRLDAGHPWVFSNHVVEPPAGAATGDAVEVACGSRSLGSAFWHGHSLVALRRLSVAGEPPTRGLLHARLSAALALRRRLYPGSDAFRLCHGEADLLPGLFVDAHGPAAVVQISCAGMDRLVGEIASVLADDLGFATVVERNDSHARAQEGLEERTRVLRGEAPAEVATHQPPLRLLVDVMEGQKTGAYLDQRENRLAVARHAPGRTCYETHCHAGGFAIAAALAGAESVEAVDSSAAAVALARRNAELNGVAARVRFEAADAAADMDARHRRRERFGLVAIDPPAFTRSRKHVPQARRALRDLNRRAMTLVEPGGILATSDCSHHVLEATFLELLSEAARGAERVLRILEVRGQSSDHPFLSAMPESRYLKCVIAQVS